MRFSWLSFLILVLFAHAGLIYIIFFGSLIQLCVSVVIFAFECSFASTAIYHRLLSHRSWNATRRVEVIGTIIGIFTFTGTSLTRTLSHRYHHMYADTELDPHSPRVLGLFKTYLPMLITNRRLDLKYVSDLIRDPVHRFIHRYYFMIIFAVLLIAVMLFGWTWGISIVIAPGALCWMNISLCNILCHMGKDDSPIINNKLIAILTFGEGLHKNHHDQPDQAYFGGGLYDIGYLWIRFFDRN